MVKAKFTARLLHSSIRSSTVSYTHLHTGDTIKVNFLGDIVASNPEIITKIQTLTLLEQNRETDIEALIKLIPGGST